VAEFKKHGIVYQLSELNRSQLYLNLIPVLNSKRCELPDDRRMIEEFRRLERRRGRSGKDSIDHPAYGGSDDVANATAGAVSLVITRPVMSAGVVPIGVGGARAIGTLMQKELPGGVTFTQPNPFSGELPAEDDDPFSGRKKQGEHWIFRFQW